MYKKKNRSDGNDATDYKIKEDSAQDFFDITELADEAPLIDSKDIKDDYDIEDEIPAVKVNTDGSNSTQIVPLSSEKNEESTDDKELMPPPPKTVQLALVKVEDSELSAIDSKSKIYLSPLKLLICPLCCRTRQETRNTIRCHVTIKICRNRCHRTFS